MTMLLHVGLVVAIGIVLMIPILQRIIRRRFDPFEPLVLFVLAYGVMFVVRPAAMIVDDRLVFPGPNRPFDVSSRFTDMLVLALVGALAFAVGYALPWAKSAASWRADIDRPLDSRRLIILAAAFTALGILALAAFAASTNGIRTFAEILHADKGALAAGQGSYRYLWLLFLVLVPAALVLYGLGLETRRWVIIACSITVTAIVLVREVPLGDRTALLPLLGGLFVLHYLQRNRRPPWRSLGALIVIALLLSPFLSDLRGRSTRGESIGTTIARTMKPARLAQPFTNGPDSEMAPALAAALTVIPAQLHFEYGRVIFEDLVLRPVPRPLWNAKPPIPRDRLLEELWPVETSRGALNPEFSVLLYFYWDFGVLGVVVGMGLFGIGARYLYERYRLRERCLSARVIYALGLWFIVIGLRNSPVDTVVWAAFMILPAWVMLRTAQVPARVRSPGTPSTVSVELR